MKGGAASGRASQTDSSAGSARRTGKLCERGRERGERTLLSFGVASGGWKSSIYHRSRAKQKEKRSIKGTQIRFQDARNLKKRRGRPVRYSPGQHNTNSHAFLYARLARGTSKVPQGMTDSGPRIRLPFAYYSITDQAGDIKRGHYHHPRRQIKIRYHHPPFPLPSQKHRILGVP